MLRIKTAVYGDMEIDPEKRPDCHFGRSQRIHDKRRRVRRPLNDVNVNPTEISIALCEDKVLVELNKEQCQTDSPFLMTKRSLIL